MISPDIIVIENVTQKKNAYDNLSLNSSVESDNNSIHNLSPNNHKTFILHRDNVSHSSLNNQYVYNDESKTATNDNHTNISDNDEIIMSAYWKQSKFAIAYFNLRTSELFLLNEINDTVSDYILLKNVYRQIQPVIIIVDSHAPKTFINCLRTLSCGSDSSVRDEYNLKNALHLLASKEYNYESCKQRIYQLSLPNEPLDASFEEREIFINSIINFHYTQTIHATGALLKYLDKNWSLFNIDSNNSPTILAINTFSLDKLVTLDGESYKALQVFNKLSHPSNFKKGLTQSNKEGLSLYGIFNRCCSKIGMQYLRLMLQQPTNDINVLQTRLDTIEFCNKPGNEEVVKTICTSLRYMRNVNGIMTRIKALRANPYEWKLLFNTLYNAVLICEICENFKGHSSLINALGSRNNNHLFQVAHHMNRVIDFDLSISQEKFTVKIGVDPELDEKKQVMAGLHELMSSIAKFELEKLPEFIEECTMVYLPNMGYLLGVKAWKRNISPEEKNIQNYRFMFQNNNYIYYKSRGCAELDHQIGDTYPEILAHEMRIMMRLTSFILKHLHSLSAVIQLCAELDCLISIAKVCKENDYKRPNISSEKIIDIKQGRHPLQELCVNTFVPNDTKSNEAGQTVTIITGSNASGKSIYLKQIALIVYLAHIGSFVPAESATIGLIDSLYTRVQTTEDIATRMSAFLIDLRQISNAILNSSKKSLIIMDEFGKGTTEVDGLGLLTACINHFLFQEENCPHLFISTHFHNLHQYLIQTNRLKLLSMEYMTENKELVFLYKLTEEIAKNSLACEIAQCIGIDPNICKRAKEVLEKIQEQYPTAKTDLQKYILQENVISKTKSVLENNTNINENNLYKIKSLFQ